MKKLTEVELKSLAKFHGWERVFYGSDGLYFIDDTEIAVPFGSITAWRESLKEPELLEPYRVLGGKTPIAGYKCPICKDKGYFSFEHYGDPYYRAKFCCQEVINDTK